MRRILGIAAVVLLAGAAAAYFFFDVNQFREPIQAQLEKTLNRKVTLGRMHLRLLPLAVAIEDVVVAENPSFGQGKSFLTAREVAVSANLMALLNRRVEVHSVRVTDPTIELIRDRQGVWNYASLGAKTQDSPSESTAISLSEIRIVNGRIGVVRDGQRAEYENIDLTLRDFAGNRPFTLDASVHFPEQLSLDVSTRATYDKAAQNLRVDSLQVKLGGLVMSGAGTVSTAAGGKLDFAVKATDASIAEAARVAALLGSAFAPDMKVVGSLDAGLKIGGSTETPEITGKLAARRLEMSRAAWKLPVRIPEISIELTPDSIKSNRFIAQCGGTKVDAAFSVANYNTPAAFLAALVSTTDASVQELLQIAGAYGMTTAAGMTGTGSLTLNARVMAKLKENSPWSYSGSGVLRDGSFGLPSLTRPVAVKSAKLRFEQESAVLDDLALSVGAANVRGSLSLRRFSAPEVKFNTTIDQIVTAELRTLMKPGGDTAAAGKPAPGMFTKVTGSGTLSIGKLVHDGITLSKVKAQCLLDRGLVRLDPLTADLFGGRHTGAISVDARGAETKIAVNSRIEQVNANELISSSTALKQLLHGKLAADANLRFVSRPGEDIARSLNGTFQMQMAEGRLSGINIVNELAKVARSFGVGQNVEPVTNIVKFTAGMNIQDGVANTNDLKMDFAGGSLAAAGQIGLADQSLKLTMLPVLSRQYSDQLGGSKVGGIMNTVLANQKGELVIPVTVGGTTAQPRFLPDAAQMAKMKAQNLLPSVLDAGRKGGLKGVLDSITGAKASDPQPQGGEPKPSLLDMFKKRK
ncbi:MAG: AsmA family protein [Bryobacteraceae bacterium]|nr:AsmA family protein [Bryobacteraceae bacterium]